MSIDDLLHDADVVEDAKARPQAEQITELAQEHYTLALSANGAIAISTPTRGWPLARPVRELRGELSRLFYAQTGKVANSNALGGALTLLEGIATHAGALVEPSLRVAHDPAGRILVDLARDGAAVTIEPGGWRVTREPDAAAGDIVWRHTKLTAPLPIPENVDVDALRLMRVLMNVDDDAWRLVVANMVAALFEQIPHPVMVFEGEQGTAKTVGARTVGRAIDPSTAQVRSQPPDLKEWITTAAGSWVTTIDNVSMIPNWFSDAICRASTGEGAVHRRLYTDLDLSVVSFRRVVMLTTIDAGAIRGDLAERSMFIHMEPIAREQRRPESAMEAEFAQFYPYITGALYTLTASVLERLPDVQLTEHPRMADFARILAAVDDLLDWKGAGVAAYQHAAEEMIDETINGSVIGPMLVEILEADGGFDGTPGGLLKRLNDKRGADKRPPKSWPGTPRKVRADIKRIAPALRQKGWNVAQPDKSGGARRLTITRLARTPPEGDRPSSTSVTGSDHDHE